MTSASAPAACGPVAACVRRANVTITSSTCLLVTYYLPTYLLPTLQGERNYHVFYMLCKAPSPVREPVGVTKWQDYTALNQKGTIEKVPY